MPSIRFFGAAGRVTGSCFMVQAAGKRVLLDCGLVQGPASEEAENAKPFPFDPAAIDAVVLSHAHLDHSGRLPNLVREGFTGPIYTHKASVDLVDILLQDAAFLQERKSRGGSILYSAGDVAECMKHFQTLEYDTGCEILPGIRLVLIDAGHILGSASVILETRENGVNRRLVYTGDLGHRDSPLLPDWKPLEQADLVLMESTYGSRCHRSRADTLAEMAEVFSTAAAEGGTILCPSFAVGRTQELLYLMYRHFNDWGLDRWQMFLDSPMAIRATTVFARHLAYLRPEARAWIKKTRLRLPNLRISRTVDDSIAINRIRKGALVIAGSGMSNGGRILHHYRERISRTSTHIIITGYQAHGTLGRRLVDGAESVTIHGREFPVRARIHTIGGISAHADQMELLAWYENFRLPPATALIHGEESARQILASAMGERFQTTPALPVPGDLLEY